MENFFLCFLIRFLSISWFFSHPHHIIPIVNKSSSENKITHMRRAKKENFFLSHVNLARRMSFFLAGGRIKKTIQKDFTNY